MYYTHYDVSGTSHAKIALFRDYSLFDYCNPTCSVRHSLIWSYLCIASHSKTQLNVARICMRIDLDTEMEN